MADRGSYGFVPRLDIDQLLSEAQHRWLRTAEICEILHNYQKFHISSESPDRPPSGSLFLFDKKVLRYFRKDGHNWRKKKDGKTVKEAHEKLKVGSVDMLHCYYAHGEHNENFQRRSYWMLEPDLMHIVFVHYLEVKGNRTTTGGVEENNEFNSNSANGTTSGNFDLAASPTSTLSSSYEDADTGDSHQASSSLQVFPERQAGNAQMMNKQDAGLLNSYRCTSVPGLDNISQVHGNRVSESDSQRSVDLTAWDPVVGHSVTGYNNLPYEASLIEAQPAATGIMSRQENAINGGLLAADNVVREQLGDPLPNQLNLQIPFQDNSSGLPKWPTGLVLDSGMTDDLDFETLSSLLDNQVQQSTEDNLLQAHLRRAEPEYVPRLSSGNDIHIEGSLNYPLLARKSLLNAEEGLKKVDSFSRWISKELSVVEDLQMQASSVGIAWSAVECETVVDGSSLSPSLSQDQRFTIIDFSPKWAHADSEIEVMILGTFLMSNQEVINCNWSCMFGEVEVPAEILVDGVLCCHAPLHAVGQVPFYVTCSNRFACSEVREFDYRLGSTKITNILDIYGVSTTESHLHLRLERLLAQRSSGHENYIFEGVREKRRLISKIMLLKEEEESQFPVTTPEMRLSEYQAKEQVIRDLIHEKLYSWLIHKVIENGNGPNILDEEGQGVLHLAAALGYGWATRPIAAVGISINFRDANGWTALHWAAAFGREQTVAVLISLGADAGALTDPSPEFPLGRTPADLASGNGHKGISGFLAELSLTSHLKKLTTNESKENSTAVTAGTEAVQTVSQRTETPLNYGDVPDALSLKDSLTAVCNATQAADRIHQMYRIQSFRWKQLSQCSNDEFNISDGCAISFVATKTGKQGQSDGVVSAAAVRIQKKYRGWKKRKEFLMIRQRIVKIQAYVRGHQVRKHYTTIIWSVGILEKVILRWRRKGSGLRGYRQNAITKQAEPECIPSQEDDYDFLKEGRKQTEERLQKALTRVKSMVRYPEAQAQYRRLLTVVESFRETEASSSGLKNTEEVADGDDLINIDSLLDDDTFMSIAFE